MENVKTVLITGGTGLIGRHLAPELRRRGWKLRLLSRSGRPVPGWDEVFQWDPLSGQIDTAAIEGVRHVIHLAGENIAGKRWTKERKARIIRSRVESAAVLRKAFEQVQTAPEVFISASGVGWYGMITDTQLHQVEEPAADDFLGQTCKLWEEAADQFLPIGTRVVKLRTGIVLASDGGALPLMALPVKLFAGCILGSGKQQMPWIHIDDLCRMYADALENPAWQGPCHAVATEDCSHLEFMQTLAKVLQRPLWPIKIPAWLLRLILGEMAGIVTEGVRVKKHRINQQMGKGDIFDLEQKLNTIL